MNYYAILFQTKECTILIDVSSEFCPDNVQTGSFFVEQKLYNCLVIFLLEQHHPHVGRRRLNITVYKDIDTKPSHQ